MRSIFLLVAAATIVPHTVIAQRQTVTDSTLRVESRVRISSWKLGLSQQSGTVISNTRDTLAVRFDRYDDVRSLAKTDLTVEVAVGSHSHTRKGGLMGFGLGALLGAALGASDGSGWFGNRFESAVLVGTAFGSIGGLFGLAIGSQSHETWVRVSPAP
jgi:hypothetical protein